MSTKYGNPVYLSNSSSGAYYRAGIRFSQSPSRVTSSTGLVTVTAQLLWRSHDMRVQDPKVKISWSGSFGSGSQDISLNYYPSTYIPWNQSTPVVVKTLTRRVTASEARAITSSLSFSLSGINNAYGTSRVSSSWTTDRKPVTTETPRTPSNVSASNRSGGGIRVTWTRNASASAPYRSQYLHRWDAVTGAYEQVANLSSTATYFDDNTTTTGNRYRYRVYAKNEAGNSGYGYSEYIYTAPYPPRNVEASKSGSNIVVTWDRPEVYPPSQYSPTYYLVWTKDGGSWQYDEGTYTDPGVTRWVHEDPDPTATYRYAVRTKGPNVGTGDSGSVYAYSHEAGDGIKLNAPPRAPIDLVPTEGVVAGESVTIGWRHRPQDGSAQQSAEVRYRASGSSSWTTKTVTGSGRTLDVGTLDPETTYEYEVRTKGEHPDWSPWASSSFGVSQRPTVTINETERETWGTSNRLYPAWTYTDPSGDSSTLYDSVLTNLTTGEVLDKRDAVTLRVPSGRYLNLAYTLQDGHTYEFRVRMADSWGVYSPWASATVTVDYATPAPPVITVSDFDHDTGTMDITVTAPRGTTPEAETLELYRYVSGGLWELVASGAAPTLRWTDPSPNYGVGTHNLYVARAVSAYPSSALSDVVLAHAYPEGCEEWLWLSSDTDPDVRVRLRGNPAVTSSRGRVKTLERHYGRTHPVEYGTTMIDHSLSVKGELDRYGSSTWRDWESVVEHVGTLVYRDPWGRREYVSLDSTQVDHGLPGFEGLSFPLTVIGDPRAGELTELYPGQALVEGGPGLYALIEGEGIDLTETGVNLYRIDPASGDRVSLVESPAGSNLYTLVRWDFPEVVYDHGR